MLADPRAVDALVHNFAAAVAEFAARRGRVGRSGPLSKLRPESASGISKETELFVGSTIREDRSLVDLLNADYTFVNERVARHYGIPGVYGSRFRRVTLTNHDQRGRVARTGCTAGNHVLSGSHVSVLRGKWLLNNIFGLPIPPPPPGVDTNLTENKPVPPKKHSGAAGAAPEESLVQQLSFGDRSAGIRA